MPNHCQNRLRVDGPPAELERFRMMVRGRSEDDSVDQEFSLAAMVMEPPEGDPRRVPSDTHQGGWDWYTWRVENWGTKWDVYRLETDHGDDHLLYRFRTAWAPPTEAIRRLGLAFPALRLTLAYMEAGMQFYGVVTIDGESVHEAWDEYDGVAVEWDPDTDEVRSIVDPDLREHVEHHGFDFHA